MWSKTLKCQVSRAAHVRYTIWQSGHGLNWQSETRTTPKALVQPCNTINQFATDLHKLCIASIICNYKAISCFSGNKLHGALPDMILSETVSKNVIEMWKWQPISPPFLSITHSCCSTASVAAIPTTAQTMKQILSIWQLYP